MSATTEKKNFKRRLGISARVACIRPTLKLVITRKSQ